MRWFSLLDSHQDLQQSELPMHVMYLLKSALLEGLMLKNFDNLFLFRKFGRDFWQSISNFFFLAETGVTWRDSSG